MTTPMTPRCERARLANSSASRRRATAPQAGPNERSWEWPSRVTQAAPWRLHVNPLVLGGIASNVPIEEVVPPDKSSKGRRTSLRAGLASQVFARSGTASEDKDAGHGPEGSASVGHAFKTGVRARARRRVRLPSASAIENELFSRPSRNITSIRDVQAAAAISMVDVRVLAIIGDPPPERAAPNDPTQRRPEGTVYPELVERWPGVEQLQAAPLSRLIAAGLIENSGIGTLGNSPFWRLTTFGRAFLDRLLAEGLQEELSRRQSASS